MEQTENLGGHVPPVPPLVPTPMLIGSKAVLYLCFSSSFLFNVVMIRHFITVNTLDMVESGCSRT